MKLITAVAALALVAGSVDVDAQKRGDANKRQIDSSQEIRNTNKTDDSSVQNISSENDTYTVDDDAPQISPVSPLAIGAFGTIDPEELFDRGAEVEEPRDEGMAEGAV